MEDLSWIPAACPGGHELGPGRLSLSRVMCRCPAGREGDGYTHAVVYCRINGCHRPTYPPGCPGPPNQR
jgi:hypothetical protein